MLKQWIAKLTPLTVETDEADSASSGTATETQQLPPLRGLDMHEWSVALDAMVGRVPDWVAAEDAGTPVGTIVGVIARRFGEGWTTQLENTEISAAHAALMADVRGTTVDSLLASYGESTRAAHQQLESTLKSAAVQRDADEKKRRGEVKRTFDAAVKTLNRVKAAMVGDEKIPIKQVAWWLAWATSIVLFSIFVGAEGLAGFDIFRFGMSPAAAIAISFLTAFIQSTLTEFGGNFAGIIASHINAGRRFKIRFPKVKRLEDGSIVRLDEDGSIVSLNPLSVKVLVAGIGCSIGCWLFAFGLFYWRVKQSSSSELLGDSSVVASAIMGIATIVFWFVRFVFSPNFDSEDYPSYREAAEAEAKARKDYESCGRTLVTTHTDEGEEKLEYVDSYQLVRSTAIEAYREALQAARKRIIDKPSFLKRRIHQFLAACGDLTQGIGLGHSKFEVAVNAALAVIDPADRQGFDPKDADTIENINRQYGKSVTHPIPEESLAQLRDFSLTVDLPTAPNPETDAEQIEEGIKPRTAQAMEPPPQVRLTASGKES